MHDIRKPDDAHAPGLILIDHHSLLLSGGPSNFEMAVLGRGYWIDVCSQTADDLRVCRILL